MRPDVSEQLDGLRQILERGRRAGAGRPVSDRHPGRRLRHSGDAELGMAGRCRPSCSGTPRCPSALLRQVLTLGRRTGRRARRPRCGRSSSPTRPTPPTSTALEARHRPRPAGARATRSRSSWSATNCVQLRTYLAAHLRERAERYPLKTVWRPAGAPSPDPRSEACMLTDARRLALASAADHVRPRGHERSALLRPAVVRRLRPGRRRRAAIHHGRLPEHECGRRRLRRHRRRAPAQPARLATAPPALRVELRAAGDRRARADEAHRALGRSERQRASRPSWSGSRAIRRRRSVRTSPGCPAASSRTTAATTRSATCQGWFEVDGRAASRSIRGGRAATTRGACASGSASPSRSPARPRRRRQAEGCSRSCSTRPPTSPATCR